MVVINKPKVPPLRHIFYRHFYYGNGLSFFTNVCMYKKSFYKYIVYIKKVHPL